jgi:hypothetical protein
MDHHHTLVVDKQALYFIESTPTNVTKRRASYSFDKHTPASTSNNQASILAGNFKLTNKDQVIQQELDNIKLEQENKDKSGKYLTLRRERSHSVSINTAHIKKLLDEQDNNEIPLNLNFQQQQVKHERKKSTTLFDLFTSSKNKDKDHSAHSLSSRSLSASEQSHPTLRDTFGGFKKDEEHSKTKHATIHLSDKHFQTEEISARDHDDSPSPKVTRSRSKSNLFASIRGSKVDDSSVIDKDFLSNTVISLGPEKIKGTFWETLPKSKISSIDSLWEDEKLDAVQSTAGKEPLINRVCTDLRKVCGATTILSRVSYTIEQFAHAVFFGNFNGDIQILKDLVSCLPDEHIMAKLVRIQESHRLHQVDRLFRNIAFMSSSDNLLRERISSHDLPNKILAYESKLQKVESAIRFILTSVNLKRMLSSFISVYNSLSDDPIRGFYLSPVIREMKDARYIDLVYLHISYHWSDCLSSMSLDRALVLGGAEVSYRELAEGVECVGLVHRFDQVCVDTGALNQYVCVEDVGWSRACWLVVHLYDLLSSALSPSVSASDRGLGARSRSRSRAPSSSSSSSRPLPLALAQCLPQLE